MKPKTILFFPFEVGLAHIGRSLAVAEELQSRGHRIIFAIPKRKHHIFANSSIQFIDSLQYYNIDKEVDIKDFSSYENNKKHVKSELKIMQDYHPDVIVTDHFFTPLIAARIANIRVFAIFNGQALPYQTHYPNMLSSPFLSMLVQPLIPIVWHFIVQSYVRPALRLFSENNISINFQQWRQSIEFINPEPDFYFPLLSKKPNVHHVGPLNWTKYKMVLPIWLDSIRPDGKTIYISFGGTGFHIEYLVKLTELLLQKNYRIVITTGTLTNVQPFPVHSNLFVTQFIPSREISSRVDVTLCHGGYGTIIDSVKSGTPVVAYPYNFDQIFHSLRMQELGIVKTVFYFNFIDVIKIFSLHTKWIEKQSENTKYEVIIAAIDEVLNNKNEYKSNIRKFNEMYPSTNGAPEAADIIEKRS